VNSNVKAELSAEKHRYSVYGLAVLSSLEIPELERSQQKKFDVLISLDDVAESLTHPVAKNSWLEVSETECLIKIPSVGRFLIQDGNSITIDRREERDRKRDHGTRMTDLRVYLLGSAFGALLHQRRLLPLHVSAVQTGHSAWAFTGDSGAGKSTLAAFLNSRFGYSVISDDVSVVSAKDTYPLLYPGPRKLKLWKRAIDHIGLQNERLIQDLQSTEKYQVYLNEKAKEKLSPLAGLIQLERCEDGEPSSLDTLTGTRAFEAVLSSVYRPLFARCFRNSHELVKDVAQLANSISVYRLRRQWSLDTMNSELMPIVELIEAEEKLFGT
jgi:hypothetical protein